MDITVACPPAKSDTESPKVKLGKHVCPVHHAVTVVPGAPAKPAQPAQPAARSLHRTRLRRTSPSPDSAQQPSTPSPPIRKEFATQISQSDSSRLPTEPACSCPSKKSARKKSSIGLLAGAESACSYSLRSSLSRSFSIIADASEQNCDRAQTPTTEPTDQNLDRRRTAEQIYADCAGSVALIKGKLGSGSGFVVSQNLIATNSHVIGLEFDRSLEIHFPSASRNGDKGPFHAELVFEDAKRTWPFWPYKTKLPRLKGAESFEFRPAMSITIIGSPGVGTGS